MDDVLNQIREVSCNYNIEKVVLFGSRARGDNSEVSDYDIAVYENILSCKDRANFLDDIDELETLKKIDIVFVDDSLEKDFLENIQKEGVTIYEQNRK